MEKGIQYSKYWNERILTTFQQWMRIVTNISILVALILVCVKVMVKVQKYCIISKFEVSEMIKRHNNFYLKLPSCLV